MKTAKDFLTESKEEIDALLEPILRDYLNENYPTLEKQALYVRQCLVNHFRNISLKNPGKACKDVPEMMKINDAIDLIQTLCGIQDRI